MAKSSSLIIALPTTLAAWCIVSVDLIVEGAEREPWYCFSASDALQQVGVASVLLSLAAVWASHLAWGVYHQLVPKGWLALLLPLGVLSFYLQIRPFGYVEDIARAHHNCPAPCVRSR